jgi:uncharacterized protein YprB with RNaseH-like and TPR domain
MKNFHQSLKTLPFVEREGYLDIEASQAGRGSGQWGICYSWAIKARGGPIYSAVLRHRSLKAERALLSKLIRTLTKFDRIYTWYGARFDIPFVRTRCLAHGLPFPEYMQLYHTDLWFVARSRLALSSNRLANVETFFNLPESKTPLEPEIWQRAAFGDRQALRYIHEHNVADVKVLELVHERLEAYFAGTRRSI